jgi:hypothetical protein
MDKVVEYGYLSLWAGVQQAEEGLQLQSCKAGVVEWDGHRVSVPYTIRHGQGSTSTTETAYVYFTPEALEAAFAEIAKRERGRFMVLEGSRYQAPSHEVSLGGHHD